MKKKDNINKIDNNKEEAREKFISGGGFVQADKILEEQKNKIEWLRVLLRIRADIIKEIDYQVLERMGMTRTGWILEAIQEKLKKEKQS